MTKWFFCLIILSFFTIPVYALSNKLLSYSNSYPYHTDRLGAFPEIENYVQEIGYKIASVSDFPKLPYEFIIVNSSIPNAYSFPGGRIVITRGFLLKVQNEAELAAVIAHEIGHQTTFEKERVRRMGAFTGSKGFSVIAYEDISTAAFTFSDLFDKLSMRSEEYEADRYGMLYMAKAGYDIQAAIDLQKHFLVNGESTKKSFFDHLLDTHPFPEARISANQQTATSISSKGNYLGAEKYAKMMAPLKQAEVAYRHFDEGERAFNRGDYNAAYEYTNKAISEFDKEPVFYQLLKKINHNLSKSAQTKHPAST